jgi:hypothetical protein
MLNNPLGNAAEEHALVTGISMRRYNDEVRFELSRSVADLFVCCASAWLERRDLAVGSVFRDKRCQSFHQSLIPFRLRDQRKRQQCWSRLLRQIGDMQKVNIRAELTGDRQRIWNRFE